MDHFSAYEAAPAGVSSEYKEDIKSSSVILKEFVSNLTDKISTDDILDSLEEYSGLLDLVGGKKMKFIVKAMNTINSDKKDKSKESLDSLESKLSQILEEVKKPKVSEVSKPLVSKTTKPEESKKEKKSEDPENIENQAIYQMMNFDSYLEKKTLSSEERIAGLSSIAASLNRFAFVAGQNNKFDLANTLMIGTNLVAGAVEVEKGINLVSELVTSGLTLSTFAGGLDVISKSMFIANALFGNKQQNNGLQALAGIMIQGFNTVLKRVDVLEKNIHTRFSMVEDRMDYHYINLQQNILKLRSDSQKLFTLTNYKFTRLEERSEALQYDVSSLKETLDSCSTLLSDSLASLRHEAFENIVGEILYNTENKRLNEDMIHGFLSKLNGMLKTVACNPYITGAKLDKSLVMSEDTNPLNVIGLYSTESVAHPSVLKILYSLTKMLNELLHNTSDYNKRILALQEIELQKLTSITYQNPSPKVELKDIAKLEQEALTFRQEELTLAIKAYAKRKHMKMNSRLVHILENNDLFRNYNEMSEHILYYKVPSWFNFDYHISDWSGMNIYEELTAPTTNIYYRNITVINPSPTSEDTIQYTQYIDTNCESYKASKEQVQAAFQILQQDPYWVQKNLKTLLETHLSKIAKAKSVCLKVIYGEATLTIPIVIDLDLLTTASKAGYYIWYEWNVQSNVVCLKAKHIISQNLKSFEIKFKSLKSYKPNACLIPLTDLEHTYQAVFGQPKVAFTSYDMYIKWTTNDDWMPNGEIPGGPLLLANVVVNDPFEEMITFETFFFSVSEFNILLEKSYESLYNEIHSTNVDLKTLKQAYKVWNSHESMITRLKELKF